MITRFAVKIFVATLLLVSLAVSVQAAPLFPLETGKWMEMDKVDNRGNTWTVRMMVFEAVTLGQQQYFRVQELNYDPFSVDGGDTFAEFYMRSTDTQVFAYTEPGQEIMVFKTGQQGDSWEYVEEGSTIVKEIVDVGPITIRGVEYTAYQYKHYNKFDPNPENYDLEWVVPGLGLVKEEDHWFDSSQSGRISYSTLARAGSNPLFFPLKSGMRLIYDANDQQGNTWKMKIEVKEQVTLDDNETYFRMRQTNYDPYGDDVDNEFFVRCDPSHLYARKLDENPPHLEYQAAGPGTTWNYSREFEGELVTIYKRISSIQSVNVLGRSYSAYVTDQAPDPTFSLQYLMSEFIVPGLGPVEMLDYWVADGDRAPLQFLLTGIAQGGAGPAVNLLLKE